MNLINTPHKIVARPYKLDDGDWGVEFNMDNRLNWTTADFYKELVGMKIAVLAHTGKSWYAVVDEVIKVDKWQPNIYHIVARATGLHKTFANPKTHYYCKRLRDDGLVLGIETTYTDEEIEAMKYFSQVKKAIRGMRAEITESLRKNPHPNFNISKYEANSAKEAHSFYVHFKERKKRRRQAND